MAVDRVSHHPTDGQASGLGTLDHPLGQFRFGCKADALGNMSGVPARQIRAPVFGQVQFAVDEGMTQRGDKGQENTSLAVFHTPGASAILGGDTSGVASAFGKAALIKDENREGDLRHLLL